MDFWKSLGSFEKRVITASVLVLLLALFYLQYGDNFFSGRGSEKPEVGYIDESVNDIRYRSAQEMTWQKPETKQKIRLGDSIFTNGTSTAKVAMKTGGSLAIAESSLVVFRQIDTDEVADLKSGIFRIHVQGSAKIAMNGEVVTLNGDNAELQVTLNKDQKPVFKTLSGSVSIKQKNKPVVESTVKPPTVSVPVPNPTDKSLTYHWRLHDLYEQSPDAILEKDAANVKTVERTVVLGWQPAGSAGSNAFVEFADDPSLRGAMKFRPTENKIAFSTLSLGMHYWRVSLDGDHWSALQKFSLDPRFLENAEPKVSASDLLIPYLGAPAKWTVNLETSVGALGFISQSSMSPDFAKDKSRLAWTASPVQVYSFTKPGIYYYRFRTVSNNQELSDWSGVQKVIVFEPPTASAPRLAKSNRKSAFVGENLDLDFEQGANSASQTVEIVDPSGKVVATSNSLKMKWTPATPGDYRVQTYSRDSYGRQSARSSTPLKVTQRPVVVAKKKVEAPPRVPASAEGSSTARIDRSGPNYMNDNYRSSDVAVEGSMFTLQSKEQQYQGEANPVATQIGIRAHHWWDANGVEGAFKAGVFSLNSAKGASSAKDVEVRYHRRFFPGFPFGLAQALQISLFGGYEMYRNSGGGLFADQYDLIKLGTYIHFPIYERWDTGGEFVYGYGTDSSKKNEISGHINYYLKRDVSLGVGYRIHLFQAGSTKSSPGYLPYREGYTEGYSSLIYHY